MRFNPFRKKEAEMSTTFVYTLLTQPASTAVNTLAYNSDSRELVVELNHVSYLYKDVDLAQFNYLSGAASTGRAYREFSKRHKSSERLGSFITFVYGVEAPVNEDADTTPASYFPLKAVETVLPEERSHRIDFVAAGRDRSYTVQATSVDDALDALTDVANALDVVLRVKGVYVSYE